MFRHTKQSARRKLVDLIATRKKRSSEQPRVRWLATAARLSTWREFRPLRECPQWVESGHSPSLHGVDQTALELHLEVLDALAAEAALDALSVGHSSRQTRA